MAQCRTDEQFGLAGVLRRVPVLLLLSACGEAAPGEDAFVDYWVDSTEFCDKLAGDCEATSRAECEELWPSKSTVQRAIQIARLDTADLAKCEKAARASDACILALSCTDLLSGEPVCERQQQRLALDCASFLTGLELANQSGADGGVASGGDAGEPNFGERVCRRIAECVDESTASDGYFECVDGANQSFASMLPDPLDIAACVERAECADITSGDSAVQRCLNFDPDATHCAADNRTLHACNGKGDCTDVDCFALCGAQAEGVALCGFSEADGHDNCDCQS